MLLNEKLPTTDEIMMKVKDRAISLLENPNKDNAEMSYALKAWGYHLHFHERNVNHKIHVLDKTRAQLKEDEQKRLNNFHVPRMKINDFYEDLTKECMKIIDKVLPSWDRN